MREKGETLLKLWGSK